MDNVLVEANAEVAVEDEAVAEDRQKEADGEKDGMKKNALSDVSKSHDVIGPLDALIPEIEAAASLQEAVQVVGTAVPEDEDTQEITKSRVPAEHTRSVIDCYAN